MLNLILSDPMDVFFYVLIIAGICLLYWAWLVAIAAEQDARDRQAPGYTVEPPARAAMYEPRWLCWVYVGALLAIAAVAVSGLAWAVSIFLRGAGWLK